MELDSVGFCGPGRVPQVTNMKYFLKYYDLKTYNIYKSYSNSVSTRSERLG